MKKGIVVLVVLILMAVGSGVYMYKSKYTGDYYYTKIVNEGKKRTDKLDSGEKVSSYEYNLKSASEKGEIKDLSFDAPGRDKPLRMNAYLKLEYNGVKGVLNWEEVKKEEIPKDALNALEK